MKKKIIGIVFMIIGLLLIVLGIYNLTSNSFFDSKPNIKNDEQIKEKDKNDEKEENHSDVPTIVLKNENCVGDICIHDISFSDALYLQIISFNIKNKADTSVSISNIKITAYDKKNNIVDEFLLPVDMTIESGKDEFFYYQQREKKVSNISRYEYTYE